MVVYERWNSDCLALAHRVIDKWYTDPYRWIRYPTPLCRLFHPWVFAAFFPSFSAIYDRSIPFVAQISIADPWSTTFVTPFSQSIPVVRIDLVLDRDSTFPWVLHCLRHPKLFPGPIRRPHLPPPRPLPPVPLRIPLPHLRRLVPCFPVPRSDPLRSRPSPLVRPRSVDESVVSVLLLATTMTRRHDHRVWSVASVMMMILWVGSEDRRRGLFGNHGSSPSSVAPSDSWWSVYSIDEVCKHHSNGGWCDCCCWR